MSPSRDCQAMRRVSTRVLPEPAPARIASGSGAAGDRVALGGVETVEERVHVRHGTARVRRAWRPRPREPARNSRRPRVVSAASQLGSPRGRSCRPLPTPRPRVAPGARPRLRSPVSSPPGGGPVRFVHRTGSFPSVFRMRPSARRWRARCRFRHQTGVHRPPHRKDARTRLQEGISRHSRGTVRPVVDVTLERFEQMVADALDEIPPALGRADGQRRGGRRRLARRRPAGAARARAARCSGSTKGYRSPTAVR